MTLNYPWDLQGISSLDYYMERRQTHKENEFYFYLLVFSYVGVHVAHYIKKPGLVLENLSAGYQKKSSLMISPLRSPSRK